MRYSVHEMALRVDNAAAKEVTFQLRHCPVWFFEARRGFLGYLPNEGAYDGVPLERGKWIKAVGAGYMRQCSVGYITKWEPLMDNLLFCSRFGIPGVHGKTDAAKGSPEWNDFAEALTAFANDWVTLSNRNAEITLIDAAKSSSALPFKDLIERADRLYARLFRGGDLSTQSREGDSNGASLQDEEKLAIQEDDAGWISEAFNTGLDEPLIEYLFGTRPKAWFKLMVPQQPDTERQIKSMEFLAKHTGKVALKTAHERLEIPMAEEGEELLTAPQAAAPAGVPPQPGATPAAAMPDTEDDTDIEIDDEVEIVENEGDGRWITLDGGRKVFIAEGQSVEDAVKQEFQKGKEFKAAKRKLKKISIDQARAMLKARGRSLGQSRYEKGRTFYEVKSTDGETKWMSTDEIKDFVLQNDDASTLAEELQADLVVALDRLNRILQIADDQLMIERLAEFRRDFPQLAASLKADPRAARVIEQITSRGMEAGFNQKEPQA
jgi:hypothetical protein